MKLVSVKAMIVDHCISQKLDRKLSQMYLHNVFLHVDLEKEIYMKSSDGIYDLQEKRIIGKLLA